MAKKIKIGSTEVVVPSKSEISQQIKDEAQLPSLVFDTQADLEAWILDGSTEHDGFLPSDLSVGQNLYTIPASEPDFWVVSIPVVSMSNLEILGSDASNIQTTLPYTEKTTLEATDEFYVLDDGTPKKVTQANLLKGISADNVIFDGSGTNYISDDDNVEDALVELDTQLKSTNDAVATKGSKNNSVYYNHVTSTSSTITISIPEITEYYVGLKIVLSTILTSTSTSTLYININDLGPYAIVYDGSTNLQARDFFNGANSIMVVFLATGFGVVRDSQIMTQTEFDDGTITRPRQVTPKLLRDNFYTQEEVDDLISSGGGGGGAVDSVNGQTGVVELNAEDIPFDGTDTNYLEEETDVKGALFEVDSQLKDLVDTKADDNAVVKLSGNQSISGEKDFSNLKSQGKVVATLDDLTTVYKFKGSVDTYNDLPEEDMQNGDVWNVKDTGINYAWDADEEVWDALGSSVDLSGYMQKPSANKGESSSKTLAYGGTFKVLYVGTDGEIVEKTMTMPSQVDISGKIDKPSSQKGETSNKTLAFSGTFKVLHIATNGTITERTMTMPSAPSVPEDAEDISFDGSGTNYIESETNVQGALVELDTQLKSTNDALGDIESALDAILGV